MGKWEMVRLGEVADIKGGKRIPKGLGYADEKAKKRYPYLRVVDFKRNTINMNDLQYIDEYVASKIIRYTISIDDVYISIAGTIGLVGVIPNSLNGAYLTENAAKLVIHDKQILDKHYLVTILNSPDIQTQIQSKTMNTSQPKLALFRIGEITFPLPPLKVQQKIADVLDKASALIELRRTQLDKLDLLIKSQFIELFGDPVMNPMGWKSLSLQKLLDLGWITYHLDGNHGGDYPRSNEFVNRGVPYISANCIVNGHIDLKNTKYLTEERASHLRKGIAQNNDVLFAHNATVGPVVILHTKEPKIVLGTSLTAYRCYDEHINPYYLKSYMESGAFIHQYESEMKQTTRNQVPITAQRKYLFVIPNIDKQKEFAHFVQQVDKSKFSIQQSLFKLELNYKSLMQKCFRGEIF